MSTQYLNRDRSEFAAQPFLASRFDAQVTVGPLDPRPLPALVMWRNLRSRPWLAEGSYIPRPA